MNELVYVAILFCNLCLLMLFTLKRNQRKKCSHGKCAPLKPLLYDLGTVLELQTNKGTVTMLKPQAVPSAAGVNLVSHRWPTRWHQSDLQISWKEGGKGGWDWQYTHTQMLTVKALGYGALFWVKALGYGALFWDGIRQTPQSTGKSSWWQ